jgi:putative aldouronate transport system substrate-binding protein
LYSETWTKVGTDIIKKIDDTRIKVIMGVEPISAWDALVDKYKADAEFQKIIKEINDSFKK